MKNVYTLIYSCGEIRNKMDIALGKNVDPELAILRFLAMKNKFKVKGEQDVVKLHLRQNKRAKSYEHDWEKIGQNYVCKDCGIVGTRKTPFSKIVPQRSDKKYKDCSWKIK